MLRNLFQPSLAAAALIAAALLSPALTGRTSARPQGDPVAEIVAKLRDQTDAADPRLVQELADRRTRAAMQALVDLYGVVNSVYMRREIVRALAQFDGVPEAAQPALQKITDVATQAKEPELRQAAFAALGRSVHYGKAFLRMIAVSNAPSEVREKAIELHVPLSDASDLAWYREIYKPTRAEENADREKERQRKSIHKAKKAGADAEALEVEPRKGPPLGGLRTIAFEALAASLSDDELVEATKDKLARIRAAALAGLEQRGEKRTLELAQAAFDKYDEKPANRVLAAQIVARTVGPKAAPEFIKRALSPTSSVELRRGLADVLVGFKDAHVDRDLVDELGNGRTHEKLFSLYAVRTLDDERIGKALQKLLADKDPEVVVETCRTLAARKETEALPALTKLVEKGKERVLVRAAIEAIAQIRRGEPGWVEELVRLARHEDVEVRTMALQTLAETSQEELLPALVLALDDPHWSTRLAALRGLERMKTPRAIGSIVARMAREEGRIAKEFGDTLRRLTGQPFAENAAGWANWWKEHEAGFRILTDEERARIEQAEEEYRLRQTTRVELRREPGEKPPSEFFGVEVISHKVVFVIDVSTSMLEVLEKEYEGKPGLSRDVVARNELKKCIAALDEGAFFNIVIFCGDFERWQEGGLAAASPAHLAEAEAFVTGVTLCGGTNLYDALAAAFEDPDVDTLVVMSDGEPTAGSETEPLVIREHVRRWNEHRGIAIDTVAIGGTFQILEWLAEDSGGTHFRFK